MRGRTGSTAVGVLGAVATLLLHSLFIVAAMWGGAGGPQHPHKPEAIGSGANRGSAEGDTAERRIIVRLMSESAPTPLTTAPSAHLAELLQAALKVEITGPDSLPLPPLVFSEQGALAHSVDAELMARAEMMGVYESQTRARIERAWTLPADVKDESFSCRALIRQHRDGRVSEVELPYDECDGSVQMRQSLINAIFTASPLPAPPHPGVFVDSFSLLLRSESVRER